MGKRNKKTKAPVTEAKSIVSKKPTTVAASEASKNGNAVKQKRTKDSERWKCQSYYYVALFIAVVSVIAIFAFPNVSIFLGTSERPSYRVLTPYAEVDTAEEAPQTAEETNTIMSETFEATSAKDYETDQGDESFDTHFEDTDTTDLPTGNEDASSTQDLSKSHDHDDVSEDRYHQSNSPETLEEALNENEEDVFNEAHDLDDSIEVKQSEKYYTDIQEKDKIDHASTSPTHSEGFTGDEKSEHDDEARPIDDDNAESDSNNESNEHHVHEIPEDNSGHTERERILDQEKDDEVSDVDNEGAETSRPTDTTSEEDTSTTTQADDLSAPGQSEYQDDSEMKSSGEINEGNDDDITDDNPPFVAEINSQQIDKGDEINDDSMKQTQTDETDDISVETISKLMGAHQDGNGLEIASDSGDNEFLEQANKDASHVDETATEAVSDILDGTSDILNNPIDDDQLTRYSHEKENIEEGETPQTINERTVVDTSKVNDQDEEIEPRSDPVIQNRQEREAEEDKYKPDEMKSRKPDSENNKVSNDDGDSDEEDEDEDEEDEVNDISVGTKDKRTSDQNEDIKETLSQFQPLETDLKDSDENYMDVSKGVRKRILKTGTGEKVDAGDIITIHCIGYLDEDPPKKFWSTKDPSQRPFTFAVGKRQVIKGWDEGALSMTLYERSRIKIEPKKAYGKFGFEAWGIPPDARIIFEMEVIKHKRMKSR